MKNLFSNKLHLFIFIAITILSIYSHFKNYTNLVNFNLDPPTHLTDAKNIVESGKINLVGPMITSKEVFGRKIFLGPFYYYLLQAAGIVTRWDVIMISVFFTMIWPVTLAILFFWISGLFGPLIALPIYAISSFIPEFIVFSRQIWNLQLIPLFSLLFLIFVFRRKNIYDYFWAGLFWGLSFNVHYASILFLPIAVYFFAKDIKSKSNFVNNWATVAFGLALAELPLIIFELRHNFYNLQTIIFQLKYGELSAGYKFNLWYYYVLPLFPLAFYLIASKLGNVRNKKHLKYFLLLTWLLAGLLFVSSVNSPGQRPLHPPGWTVNRQKEIADIIVSEKERNFEVAQTISSDTRSMELRWWLRQKGVLPMSVEDYPKASVLYLVSTKDRPPETEGVWEVSSIRPFKVVYEKDFGDGIVFYKLKK